MAFGGFENKSGHAPIAEINVTPMVDVMLVLLVIFIITAPLFTHAVKLDLPDAQAAAAEQKPETISLSIDAENRIYWNNEPIGLNELGPRFIQAAEKSVQPEIHLRADQATRYEYVAKVMAAAQQAGLKKLGFVTDPPKP